MKRSKSYYLKRMDHLVCGLRENKSISLNEMHPETLEGLRSVLDEYLMSTFMSIGDTAFNRLGYRNATDKIIEHLKTNG